MPLVVADPMLLDQVLSNVIGNAVQHAGPGARQSRCRRHVGEARPCWSVTDDGPGIAPDVLPRIFDKFGKPLTQVRDGSGNRSRPCNREGDCGCSRWNRLGYKPGFPRRRNPHRDQVAAYRRMRHDQCNARSCGG